MAQSSWPFENIDTTETQFSQWARNIGEGVRVGVADDLEPFADNSGMNVKVRAGEALVRGHYYKSTAVETLTVTAADPTNPRVDLVVLELDPIANSIILKVIAGTPASSPVAPTPVQTDAAVYQQVIATVAVAVGVFSIESADVTDSRTFFVPNSAKQNTITGAATTITDSNLTINRAVVSDGSGKVAISAVTSTELGYLSGVTSAVQTQINTKANLTVTVRNTSTNTAITSADNGNIVRLTGATGRTITIDNVLSIGQGVDFLQDGTGQITFAAGSGVTLRSKDNKVLTAAQYSGATVRCVASGIYHLVGDLG
jgi:hypothetical protein